MAEFAYNNMNKTSSEYMSFKLNYGYHLYIFDKENVDPYSRSKVAYKLTKKLKNLIAIYRKNL